MSLIANFFLSLGQTGLRTTVFLEETEHYQGQCIDAKANTVFLEEIENEDQKSDFTKAICIQLEVYQSFLQFLNEKWQLIEATMDEQLKKIRAKTVNFPAQSKFHAYIQGTVVYQTWFDYLFLHATKESHNVGGNCKIHLQLQNKSLQFNSKLLTLLSEHLNELNMSVEVWNLLQ